MSSSPVQLSHGHPGGDQILQPEGSVPTLESCPKAPRPVRPERDEGQVPTTPIWFNSFTLVASRIQGKNYPSWFIIKGFSKAMG